MIDELLKPAICAAFIVIVAFAFKFLFSKRSSSSASAVTRLSPASPRRSAGTTPPKDFKIVQAFHAHSCSIPNHVWIRDAATLPYPKEAILDAVNQLITFFKEIQQSDPEEFLALNGEQTLTALSANRDLLARFHRIDSEDVGIVALLNNPDTNKSHRALRVPLSEASSDSDRARLTAEFRERNRVRNKYREREIALWKIPPEVREDIERRADEELKRMRTKRTSSEAGI